MIFVTRRETFSASHRLFNPDLTEAKNSELFGKCANPNGHGHNYTLEVTVAGEPSKDSGYVIDIKKLKEIINSEVIAKVDHKHLNLDVDFLRGINPTSENVVKAFWDILNDKIIGGKLYSIRLHETDKNSVEYRG